MARASFWDDAYLGPPERRPWDTGRPAPQLVDFVRRGLVKPCWALDIGCGTGTNVIFLAQNRFEAGGVDISREAIRLARVKAKEASVESRFYVGDVLHFQPPRVRFGFLFDRGCFHALDPSDRQRYVARVQDLLEEEGKMLLLCFRSDEPDPSPGPPYQLTREEITGYFSEAFRVLSIKRIDLEDNFGRSLAGYACFMGKG